jgi:cell division septal protein FtsQ
MILGSTTRRRAVLRPNRKHCDRNARRRGSLLEVKARSRTVRRQRIGQSVGLILKGLLIAGVVSGLWYGGHRAVDALFLSNEEYVIRRIDVETDGSLTPPQVVAASGLKEGTGIFTVSLGGVCRRLEQLPQIQKAQVERSLPDRVSIRVTERQPVAWIVPEADGDPATSPDAHLIDGAGVLIRPLGGATTHLHLPVITGVRIDAVRSGEPVATRDVGAALELLRVTATNLMQARWEIRGIDLSRGYCMVVTDSRKSRVTLPTADVEGQVARLGALLGWCEGNGRELLTANLLPTRNVPVTFVPVPVEETAAGAPAGAPAVKPGAEPPVRRAIPVRPSNSKNRARANG